MYTYTYCLLFLIPNNTAGIIIPTLRMRELSPETLSKLPKVTQFVVAQDLNPELSASFHYVIY